MKAKISLMLIAVMIIGLFGGIGTYAWFTSSATSTENTFDAGSLEIEKIQYGETPTPLFSTSYDDPTWNDLYAVGLWYPGKKVGGSDRSLTIHNSGTLPARVYGLSARMTNFITPSDCPDSDAAKEEFAEKMIITVKSAGTIYYQGTLKGLMESIKPFNQNIVLNPNPGITVDLNFEAELLTTAGNLVQGVEATVDLIVHATQNNDDAVDHLVGD